jgi:hypothetical protein
MKEEFVTDAEIRRFLLSSVDDSERQRIESLFISDPECNQKILIAEDDLIEEYLENSLAPTDRDKFLAQYGRTPEQQRRLRISRLIREHAASETKLTESTPAIAKWRAFVSELQPRNLKLFIPLAATLTIACVIGAVLLVESNNRRLAIERELAELNTRPNLTENSSQVVSLVLPPISLRSAGRQSELTLHPDTRLVELALLWIQKEQYPSYQAMVRRVGSNEQFKISRLHIESRPSGNAIRVRLPTHLLKDGLYQIVLTGVRADGEPATSEEYSFNVTA